MAVGKRDFTIYKGDDYTHVFTFNTSAGVPIVFTGNTFTSQLRKVKTQTTPDATFTCTVTDGPNGEVTIVLPKAITAALDVGCYFWDLQRSASGVITTVLVGEVKVSSDVTR